MWKVWGPSDIARMLPPWAVTMALATDRPMPWPPVSELREASAR